MDEATRQAKQGKLMRAVKLLMDKGVKTRTIAMILKIDEVDARAIVDEIERSKR